MVCDLELHGSRSFKVKGHSVKWNVAYVFVYVNNTNHVCIFNGLWDTSHFEFQGHQKVKVKMIILILEV